MDRGQASGREQAGGPNERHRVPLGMRNEIAANKLNYVDDLHKLFHHAC
jgi:hypothetical protein